jgi:hypothetical protein
MATARERALVAAVVLAACIPYLPVIPDYFVQDDFGTVYILTERPWTMFPRWFTMPWMEYIWGYTPDEIRPFVALTYQLSGKFTPSRPELHHIMNIAFHAGNALLVMAIARVGAGLSPLAAAFAGVVFGVLPSGAESAAWITGRVDSMPAFFYLATFLAYVRWRLDGRRSLYIWSLVLFFVTLFSKQNAITMAASIAAFDLLVLDRQRRGSLTSAIVAWMPFVLMTAGYLLLRRALLGHTVRGGVTAWHQVETFLGIVWRHFQRVTLGHTGPFADWEIAAAVVVAALAIVIVVAGRVRTARVIVCFVIGWWWIGAAPAIVAGYESPRHVYLASAAWAFLLALILDWLLARATRPALRIAIAAVAIAIVSLYTVRLHETLQTWHLLARISKSAVERVNEEARAAAPGTLILMRLPVKSWEWGIPFVLRPPYQTWDLTTKVRVVAPWQLYCCGTQQWGDYAREQLRAWMASSPRAPIVALNFDPKTGAITRVTDADQPELATLVPVLLQTDTAEAMDQALIRMMEKFVR